MKISREALEQFIREELQNALANMVREEEGDEEGESSSMAIDALGNLEKRMAAAIQESPSTE
tara:strand:- start:136 stop:321 length:186 start_codon:yes stop_codon:yes gene_type:complete